MRTIKEIKESMNKLFEDYENNMKALSEVYNKDSAKLEKELESIKTNFKNYVKKQFGRLKVNIAYDDTGLKITTKQGELILNVAHNEFKAQNIEQELADEIRAKYIDIWGLPEENVPNMKDPYKSTDFDLADMCVAPTVKEMWEEYLKENGLK